MHLIQETLRNLCNWSDAAIMSSGAASPSHLDLSDSTSPHADTMKTTANPVAAAGHMMSADDPDNPQNWPLYNKIYVSAVAFAFTWVV